MGDVRRKLLDLLDVHFSYPESAEGRLDSWQDDYATHLAAFSDEALQAAAKLLISERKSRVYPTIAHCIEACERSTPSMPTANYVHDTGPFSTERIAAAYRMIRSDLGREAAAGDWIIGLWDFCREQGRPPNRFEAEDIKAKQAAHAVTRRGWLDGDPMSPFAAIAAKAIVARQNTLEHLKFEAQQPRSRAA